MNQLELNLDPINCDICGGEIEPDRTPEGKIYWTQGNDARPVTEGRACNDCNVSQVVPARMQKHVDDGDISITVLGEGSFFKG